jgi:hypothetical protein
MTAERLKQKRGIEKSAGKNQIDLRILEWPANWKGAIKRSNIGRSSHL